jgi:hypothetical protein
MPSKPCRRGGIQFYDNKGHRQDRDQQDGHAGKREGTYALKGQITAGAPPSSVQCPSADYGGPSPQMPAFLRRAEAAASM